MGCSNTCLGMCRDGHSPVWSGTCCLGVTVRLFSRLMGIGLGVCTGKGFWIRAGSERSHMFSQRGLCLDVTGILVWLQYHFMLGYALLADHYPGLSCGQVFLGASNSVWRCYLAISSCLRTHACSCEYQPDYVSDCNCVLQDPPGSVLACNIELHPVAASFAGNCVGPVWHCLWGSLSPEAWGSGLLGSAAGGPPSQGYHSSSQTSPPADFQCVGKGGWELAPRLPWAGPATSASRSLGSPRASLREREGKRCH